MEYGYSRDELVFQKLLDKLKKGETLSLQEIEFIEKQLKNPKRKKIWAGLDILRNGFDKLTRKLN